MENPKTHYIKIIRSHVFVVPSFYNDGMAKLNWEKANRKPVQRDGAYSVRDNIRPRTRKEATGKFSKFKDEWVVSIVDGHSIPHDKIVSVVKSDGTQRKVRLLTIQGSKQLQYAKIDFYTFANVE